MRTPQEILRELLKKGDFATEEDFDMAIAEFKDTLENGPIKPLAYAGIAHCKAKLDYHPFTVIDYFTIALSFNTQNEVIWRLLSEYAMEQSKRMSMSYPEIDEDSRLGKGIDRYPIEPLKPIKAPSITDELDLPDLPPIKTVPPIWKQLGITAFIMTTLGVIAVMFDK